MGHKQPQPAWFEGALPENSWRSYFRWGNPNIFKHPNPGLVEIVKQRLGFSHEELEQPHIWLSQSRLTKSQLLPTKVGSLVCRLKAD